MTCETPPVNSSFFVDTAPCNIDSVSGSFLVHTGSLYASELLDSCKIELMVLTSWNGTKGMNSSYLDIHSELLYGFELSWLKSFNRVAKWHILKSTCYVDSDTNKVDCGFSMNFDTSNYILMSLDLILTAVLSWTDKSCTWSSLCDCVFNLQVEKTPFINVQRY